MKLLFKKDWGNFPGHIIKAGKKADISGRVASKLISDGIANEIIEQELPGNFPGRAALIKAGFNTIEKVREIKDFDEIPGIGNATETKIIQYLVE